jgi:drug/metabolite transporter (DMT)-like permease
MSAGESWLRAPGAARVEQAILRRMTGRSRGIAFAFLAACISGVSVFLNSFAVREFGDATLYTTVKNLLAAVFLFAAAAVLNARGSSAGLSFPRGARERIGLVAVGVIGGGLAFALFFQGLAETSPTSAAFVQKTLVIWVAILAVVSLGERLSATHVGAIGLLIVGQILASGGLGPIAFVHGDGLVFVATLLWSVEVVIAKSLLRDLSPLTVAVARMGIGFPILLAIAIATGATSQLASITPQAWAWVALTGVILSVYVAVWYAALAKAGAIDVTAVLVFGAVITAFLGTGVRGTSLAPAAVGLGLITIGSLLIARYGNRSRTTLA